MRNDNLPELLRICRQRAELNQEQLAAKLYIDQAIISKIESGKIQPAYSLVKQWARVTNSIDLIGMDFSGNEGWRKLKQLEERFDKIRDLVNAFKSRYQSPRIMSHRKAKG
jgi:transcriptional regulator with XRE-family HTH domain